MLLLLVTGLKASFLPPIPGSIQVRDHYRQDPSAVTAIRSKEAGALPQLMTHGWPGSIVEFLDVIGPLTGPARTDVSAIISPNVAPVALSTCMLTPRRPDSCGSRRLA